MHKGDCFIYLPSEDVLIGRTGEEGDRQVSEVLKDVDGATGRPFTLEVDFAKGARRYVKADAKTVDQILQKRGAFDTATIKTFQEQLGVNRKIESLIPALLDHASSVWKGQHKTMELGPAAAGNTYWNLDGVPTAVTFSLKAASTELLPWNLEVWVKKKGEAQYEGGRWTCRETSQERSGLASVGKGLLQDKKAGYHGLWNGKTVALEMFSGDMGNVGLVKTDWLGNQIAYLFRWSEQPVGHITVQFINDLFGSLSVNGEQIKELIFEASENGHKLINSSDPRREIVFKN
jgi:hypothetical protein